MPAIATMDEGSALHLLKRQFGYCDEDEYYRNGYCYRNSRWNDWGRWVALAVIVILVLIAAFLFSCINNRRRRRRGAPPMYGTGWVPGANYKPNEAYTNPAPPYTPSPMPNQATGNTFNSNEGYYGNSHNQQAYGGNPYGGQQSGVELQTPQHSYQRDAPGQNVYAPPSGPPPGKGDGIIR